MNKFFSYSTVFIMAVVFTTAFIGCLTPKKVAKKMDIFKAKQSVVVAEKCYEYYPIVESKIDTTITVDSSAYKAYLEVIQKDFTNSRQKNDSTLKAQIIELRKRFADKDNSAQIDNLEDAIKELQNELVNCQKISTNLPPISNNKTFTKIVPDKALQEVLENKLQSANAEIIKLRNAEENLTVWLKAEKEKVIEVERLNTKLKWKFYGSWFLALVAILYFIYRKIKGKINPIKILSSN